MTLLVEPLVITVLVVLQVGMWQYRMGMAARQRKRLAALLAGVDAVLWVAVLGQVLTHLDRPGNVAGYAVGVAAGVYLGSVADERSARDPLEYRLVLPGAGVHVLEALRAAGWPATAQPASGLGGSATVVFVTVDADQAPRLEDDLAGLAPGAFWTCTRLRSATSVVLPAGFLGLRPRLGVRPRSWRRAAGARLEQETGRPDALRGARAAEAG